MVGGTSFNFSIAPSLTRKKKGIGHVFGPRSPSRLPPHASIIATGSVVLQEKHSAAHFQEGRARTGYTAVIYNIVKTKS